MVAIGSFCNLAALIDRPSGQARSPWRITVAREYRRHPRLFLTSVACLAVALACWIAFAVIELT